MREFRDQLNRVIRLANVPKRIISIVPSQTELLFFMGLDNEVTGITKFCIHPADKFKITPKVGGTKQLDLDKIRLLSPDLIIANKEENDREQVELLMQICPVWISDINDLDSALQMIHTVGEMTGKDPEATALCIQIKDNFNRLSRPPLNLRVAYLIWRKPNMVAGANTFIDGMLQTCGFTNVIQQERYPTVNASQLTEMAPDVVILSSEPYPFGQKHIDEFSAILPDARIILADGEMFSWYGSRLLHAPGYFKQLVDEVTKN
ncbi:ABC transporter substrate-binding protein [Mucilaginibacter celer]|uniref:Cobalamin-binding protein n=1 Tax=Mucilaginibacter celer TaxID=2305508 RepID=A0A494VP25_9SPHI|nr:helical backbone metal receptor [Mucilaginibacter celer]AYL95551.1 cobalamin-binding protein [Mucilaginibacter celer]